jgi:nicotinate-nucleotide adenylyltransferase
MRQPTPARPARITARPPVAGPGQTVGLLGGSFNPPHVAHRLISEVALKRLGLDKVWWVVSPGNPLKKRNETAPLAERLRLCRAIATNPHIIVTDFEADLPSPYTASTLAFLKARSPLVRFVWIMGADNLAQFHLWKDWQTIARDLPIAVIARPGYDDQALASPAMAWLRRYRLAAARMKNRHEWSAPALIELRFDPDPRSATELRRTDPDWASRFAGPSPRDGVTHSLIQDPAHLQDRDGEAGA